MYKTPIYVKALRIIAVIIVVYGLIRFGLGMAVATGAIVEPQPGEYLGTQSSGEAIDQGIYRMIAGLVIWVIAYIANSQSNKKSD